MMLVMVVALTGADMNSVMEVAYREVLVIWGPRSEAVERVVSVVLGVVVTVV